MFGSLMVAISVARQRDHAAGDGQRRRRGSGQRFPAATVLGGIVEES